MRAAAIAHAYFDSRMIEPFGDARVNLFRGNALERADLPDVALVFGGDGAVNRVVQALAYSQTPLLVVPAGTANDFARCIGLGGRDDAVRAWRRFLQHGDNVRTIDLGILRPLAAPESGGVAPVDSRTYAAADGRIPPPSEPLGPAIMQRHLQSNVRQPEESGEQAGIYFCGIAGLGLDAATNRLANRMPSWLRRHGGYTLAALMALATYRPLRMRLHSFDRDGDETKLEGPLMFAAIGNSPEYGNGMKMCPRARFDDGQLDLCYVPRMPRAKVLFHFARLFSGTHLEISGVRYLRTSQLFVECDEPAAIYGDGEYLCQAPAEIGCAPKALRVIVP